MDIHVEAPNHANYTKLDRHYRKTLSDRYEAFDFIKSIEARVKQENNVSSVKLIINIEKDPMSFVEASDISEDKAFKLSIQKMDQVVRKYKSKHYHGI